MNTKESWRSKLGYCINTSVIVVLTILIILLFMLIQQQNSKINYLNNLADFADYLFYSEMKERNQSFNFLLKKLDNADIDKDSKEKLYLLCTQFIEDGTERIDVAKAYDCLARLEDLNTPTGIYKAIKNLSYSLDTSYRLKSALNLGKLIINGYEHQLSNIDSSLNALLTKYFTGYTRDEIPFLEKLVAINIPELSARSLYRLSLIHILGRSSFKEELYEPNFKLAYQKINEVVKMTGIKQNNILDIVFIVNEKFAKYAGITMASALLNSNLDSFYKFHIVMSPEHLLSDKTKNNLSSMNYIRDYSIDFTTFDNNIMPVTLMQEKMQLTNHRFPLLVNYRLYLDRLYPQLDQILYLDADLLVFRDLNYFKTLDMTDYVAATAIEYWRSWSRGYENAERCNRLKPNFYKNSGVMFFNLQTMRTIDLATLLQKQLNNNSECPYTLPDQDLIALTIPDKILPISARWNTLTNTIHRKFLFSNFISHFPTSKPWTETKEKLWKEAPDKLEQHVREHWLYREITPWAIKNNSG